MILAIAFLVVVGAIGAAVLASVTSGLNDRAALDQARNKEYAADGGIEAAIAQVRSNMTNGSASTPCIPPTTSTLNGVQIQVSCKYVQGLTLSGLVQRNAFFTAQCASVQQPECPNTMDVIINAQVNFASTSPLTDPSITVSQTYIQAWSVNG